MDTFQKYRSNNKVDSPQIEHDKQALPSIESLYWGAQQNQRIQGIEQTRDPQGAAHRSGQFDATECHQLLPPSNNLQQGQIPAPTRHSQYVDAVHQAYGSGQLVPENQLQPEPDMNSIQQHAQFYIPTMPHQVIGTCHNWQSDSQHGTSQNRNNFAGMDSCYGKDQYRQHVPNGDHQPQAQPNLYPQHGAAHRSGQFDATECHQLLPPSNNLQQGQIPAPTRHSQYVDAAHRAYGSGQLVPENQLQPELAPDRSYQIMNVGCNPQSAQQHAQMDQVIGTCHNWQSDSQQETSQNRNNFAGMEDCVYVKDQYHEPASSGYHPPQAQPNCYPNHSPNPNMNAGGQDRQHEQQNFYTDPGFQQNFHVPNGMQQSFQTTGMQVSYQQNNEPELLFDSNNGNQTVNNAPNGNYQEPVYPLLQEAWNNNDNNDYLPSDDSMSQTSHEPVSVESIRKKQARQKKNRKHSQTCRDKKKTDLKSSQKDYEEAKIDYEKVLSNNNANEEIFKTAVDQFRRLCFTNQQVIGMCDIIQSYEEVQECLENFEHDKQNIINKVDYLKKTDQNLEKLRIAKEVSEKQWEQFETDKKRRKKDDKKNKINGGNKLNVKNNSSISNSKSDDFKNKNKKTKIISSITIATRCSRSKDKKKTDAFKHDAEVLKFESSKQTHIKLCLKKYCDKFYPGVRKLQHNWQFLRDNALHNGQIMQKLIECLNAFDLTEHAEEEHNLGNS